ncbi:hypothetical protein ACWEFJ_29885 [Actinosynnema sp. NPDC004786]
MNPTLILRSSTDRIDRLRAEFIGAEIVGAYYLQTVHGGLTSLPSDDVHGIDIAVVLHLSTGVFSIEWDRDDLVEGLSVEPSSVPESSDYRIVVPASRSPQWQDLLGGVITDLHLMWQVSEKDCPESLWSLRLGVDSAKHVVIALGELTEDGGPTYHPDGLVVMFDGPTASSYRPPGANGSAWRDDGREGSTVD